MAKERNLPSKSTLTTSDYIRVVGSDNASYKQLVTSVLALNGTFYDGAWKANADLNNFKTNGVYWISSNPTNAPTGEVWFPLAVIARDDTVRQIVISSVDIVYTRVFQSNAWGAWVKQPTRAEVDALNSKFVAERVSKSSGLPEIPANTSIRVEVDASKSGYTPIGIIEVTGSGNNGLLVQDFYFQGAIANLYFRNVTSSAKTAAAVTIKVLYMKN